MNERNFGSGEVLVGQLIDWAKEHERTNEKVVAHGFHPDDPENFPGQVGYYVEGDPQSGAVVDAIAASAEPESYPRIVELAEEQIGQIEDIAEKLDAEDNVWVETCHKDLIDVPLAQAAIKGRLDGLNLRKYKTGIVISKMVAFLGYKIGADDAQAVRVLKMLENEIFLSYPKSESSRIRLLDHLPAQLHRDEINKHNHQMRNRVASKLEEGSMLLAIAPSGTTDKPSAEDPNKIIMAKMNSRTAEMMQAKHTFIQPVAISLDKNKPVFKLGKLRAASSEEKVQASMSWIASTLTEEVPGKVFEYR